MANILGLALKISADSTQLKLTPAERALQTLGAEAAKLTGVFEQFTGESTAAAAAQQKFATDLAFLNSALKTGQITAQQYAEEFANLAQASEQEAAALREAARITESVRTPFERFQRTAGELAVQLEAGRISQETYNRAVEQASRGLTDAERASAGLAARTAQIADAGGQAQLQFNELSGIFSILPGPLGNIAGRISGITSASEGLSRVFAGGLSQGVSAIGASVAALANPFTIAAAGIVATGVAAQQVVAGLLRLEDRVENLGNTADKLGLSFEFIQTLEESANRSGTSIDAVSAAFGRLQKSVLGVDEESKAAQKALAEIGVTSQELADLDPQEQYLKIGQALAGIEDPAKRTATAIALFGKTGTDLIPFFNNIAGASADMERFNATLSAVDRTRIDGLGTAFDGVAVALRGFGQELLTPFIGITQSISEGLSPALTTLGRLLGSVLDAISPFTSALGLVANVALQAASTVGRLVGVALEPLATVGRALSSAFDVLSQTFSRSFDAVNSVIGSVGRFLQFEGSIAAVSRALSAVASTVAETLSPIFERLSEIGQRVGAILSAAFEQLGSFFASFASSTVTRIGEVISTLLEVTGISDTVAAVAERIGEVFGSAYDIVSGVVSTIGGLIERVLKFAEDWLGITATIAEPVQATIEVDAGDTIADLIAENKELGKVIDGITKSVSDAINESAQFGQAGFDAALQYQQSIDDLKEKLSAGLFNEETFRIEAEKAKVAFDAELKRIEEDASLEVQITENATKTLAGIDEAISKAIEKATEFGEEGFSAALSIQNALTPLKEQFDRGIINEESVRQGVAKANAEYEKQLEAIKKTRDEQAKAVEDDKKRIDSLLGVTNAAGKVAADLATVEREISRVQQQISETGVGKDGAAEARLRELQTLQTQLDAQLEAAAQGFDEGFADAFAKTGEKFNELAAKAGEFGQAGADAARRLSEGIQAAQDQARDGILNAAAYEQQVEQQKRLFENELENIKKTADERKKINEFVDKQLIAFRFGGDNERAEAAIRAVEIEKEIIRVQEQVRIARANGDREALNAGVQRIGQLDQVLANEQAIANGRKELEKQLGEQRDKYLKQLEQQQQQAQQAQQKYLEEQAKAVEAENQRQVARIRELNTLGSGVIQGNDIRTAEGAALFLNLAANQQDPALIEARLQTRRLTELRDTLVAISAQFAGPVVQIGGGVG
jgi:hypothetical protein